MKVSRVLLSTLCIAIPVFWLVAQEPPGSPQPPAATLAAALEAARESERNARESESNAARYLEIRTNTGWGTSTDDRAASVQGGYSMVPRQDRDGNTYYEPQRTAPGAFPRLALPSPNSFPNNMPFVVSPFQPDELEIRELVSAYRETTDEAEREQIREKLALETKKVFEKRLADRKQEMAEVQAELDSIIKMLTERESMAEKIIDRRVAELVNDPDPLAWEYGSGATHLRQRDLYNTPATVRGYGRDGESLAVPRTGPNPPVAPDQPGARFPNPRSVGPGVLPPSGKR